MLGSSGRRGVVRWSLLGSSQRISLSLLTSGIGNFSDPQLPEPADRVSYPQLVGRLNIQQPKCYIVVKNTTSKKYLLVVENITKELRHFSTGFF